jgi:protein-L-isoaspartate(D-aspartate) O-methyltransferase
MQANLPKDTLKHQGMRRKLIASLSSKDDYRPEVLEAMNRIPRHFFLDPVFETQAYEDIAFRIAAGQTISQPSTVAYQSTLLNVQNGHKVLEVGTGSGYQSCVLLELGAKVFTIERQRELYDKTTVFLRSMGYNPKFFYGDGYKGLPTYGPFDRILVTCGAPFVPEELLSQLTDGGIMVIPVGEGKTQRMTRIVRGNLLHEKINRKEIFSQATSQLVSNGVEYYKEELKDCSFVPMLSNRV